MSESFSLIIAGVLLGVLALLAVKIALTARALGQEPEDSPSDSASLEGCPAEVAERIFSGDDRQFVEEFKSPSVERLFAKERKAVASLWVRQTAARIRGVMQEHASAARRSADLRPSTEARLLVQYAGSMVVCGALLLLIQVGGLLWLRGLAGYAQRLSQKIGDAQQAFAAAADSQRAV